MCFVPQLQHLKVLQSYIWMCRCCSPALVPASLMGDIVGQSRNTVVGPGIGHWQECLVMKILHWPVFQEIEVRACSLLEVLSSKVKGVGRRILLPL